MFKLFQKSNYGLIFFFKFNTEKIDNFIYQDQDNIGNH